jgi:sec-independent protein translocase protein TatC
MTEDKLPFTSHLEELRKRIIVCLIAVAAGFLLTYNFAEEIFTLLVKPLQKELPSESWLIFTGLTEAFVVYLKIAFFAGLILASPVILWEIWCFVAPGLYDYEKKYVFPFVISASLLFFTGVIFCYLVVFPFSFKFFMSYSTDMLKPLPAMKEYLSFSFQMLLAFGVIFELPIFVLFLAKIGIVTERMLRQQRKFAIVAIFIVAAILTPPDVFSQCLMAAPLLILYEISIIVAKVFGKKSTVQDEKEARDAV